MDIVALQLKTKYFYYQIHDSDHVDNTVYIENSDERFFGKMKKIGNKITELLVLNDAKDFVKCTLDGEKYIAADVLKNINFVRDHFYKDKIIVLDSVVDDILMASLLELRKLLRIIILIKIQ